MDRNKEQDLITIKAEYCKVIDLLISSKDDSGISNISQHDIQNITGIFQGRVNKIIKNLHKIDNCVEMVAPGKYIVHKSDMEKYGPMGRFNQLIVCLKNNPEYMNLPYSKQSELMNIPIEALRYCYPLMHFLFGGSVSKN